MDCGHAPGGERREQAGLPEDRHPRRRPRPRGQLRREPGRTRAAASAHSHHRRQGRRAGRCVGRYGAELAAGRARAESDGEHPAGRGGKRSSGVDECAGNAVAGLYMGMKPKYSASMQNVVGYASYQNALHFYLFSADGRVYRAYDRLEVPRGAISRFDFDAAERRDPMNSGRYTVDNGKLIIKMHGSPQETIAADAPRGGKVTINTITYERQ